MSRAHKNECRGGARQIVKSISKSATAIIAGLVRFGLLSELSVTLFALLVLQGILMALPGVLR